MTKGLQQTTSRNTERIWLLAIMLLLAALFTTLFHKLEQKYADVSQRLADGSMVNINQPNAAAHITAMLQKGFYFEDPQDVQYIGKILGQRLAPSKTEIDNIGELNKSRFAVDAEDAFLNGGASFKKRVVASRQLLGFTGADEERFVQEQTAPPLLNPEQRIGDGAYTIAGTIVTKTGDPVAGVLVRLQMVVAQDSVYSNTIEEATGQQIEKAPGISKTFAVDTAGSRQLISLSAYARTNANGAYAFTGAMPNRSFQVIPLQPGFQFGRSKGVQQITKNQQLNFTQTPHTIRLFSNRDFSNLKKEQSLIVRQPQEAYRWYWIIVFGFFAAFLLLHLLLSLRFSSADQFVVPAILLLTGLSLLTLFSLQDLLRDRFLAKKTFAYFLGGYFGLLLLLFFDLRRFTTDSGLYRMFMTNKAQLARGIQWAALAALLLLLTILLGTGPEGSGVKVNLLGFQPSEVVKFLVIIFLAGFFTANEKFISEYVTMKKRWSFFYVALFAILFTILLFLMLGDLGPAIVVCFSFIVLFSFARGDFFYMAGAVVLFVLANWMVQNVWLATGITVLVLALTMRYVRKQLSESAIMALVVIAGFMLIDQVPLLQTLFPGPVERLTDRKAIWLNKWDNEVFGGDQIANGIWAMASGGVKGQGVGEGFAKTIPEAHTDMILPAIGEEFGWAGIVSVFILFLLYLHRSLLIGRQTGRPFLFYLCGGIGIATFVQFLLIAGGSVGALPLSGVSLPLVSYGGTSLICNLLAAGFLLSASQVRGTAVQMRYVSQRQDKNLMPALVAACVGLVLLTINVSRYLFNNKQWVVQPALVADRSGGRMFSYNPRIAILMNRLQAGSIFDRNGRLLATSSPQLIQKKTDSLVAAGLQKETLQQLTHKRLERFYPFAEQMFFWTGDANTNVFMGSNNGYFAEYRLDAELRGFETPTTQFKVVASKYRENRFLPKRLTEMTVVQKDYSALAPLLLAGVNSQAVKAFKQRNRDVQLSMDAALQTSIQQSLAADDSLQDNRISVVIMNDATGDVLSSALLPLPPIDDWDRLTMPVTQQNQLANWITTADLGFTYTTQPGSTAKLATALAAFNKLGMAAATKTLYIKPQDLIRVKSAEPDEAGYVSMERALVKSNNSYFIKLANEERLQEEMGTLYLQTGMFLHGVGGYFYERDTSNKLVQESWRNLWRSTEFSSLKTYNKNDIRKTRGRGVSGMAWGQGELVASPAAVARLAAGIANNGRLMANRYILKISDSLVGTAENARIANDAQYATTIASYMKKQSAGKFAALGVSVAGKTGTPERIWQGQRINDGWYVFFVPEAKGTGHIVVCIRMEKARGSSEAVKLAGKHIIPKLLEKGYINNSGTKQ